MKKVNFILFVSFIIFLLANNPASAQFKITGEFRPRTELLHGYKSLAAKSQDPIYFTSQRTRLNFNYDTEEIKARISLQDVRTWGSQSQLNTSDALSALHEAWAEIPIAKTLSLKVGRQEIVYDDHRMFGDVGWTQQARSHDIAILKFNEEKLFKADIGIAYNQNQKPSNPYVVASSYKAMQYIWFHKDFKSLNLSLLFLNNGNQLAKVIDSVTTKYSIIYSQTAGGRIGYKVNNLSAHATFYLQTGKDNNNTNLNASNAGFDIGYGLLDNKLKIIAGFELLSGTNQSDLADSTFNENNSFTPFYGTNHKFNGHMDYFYVSNHIGNVGLTDIFFKVKWAKEKLSVGIDVHLFSSSGDILDPKDSTKTLNNNLGTELDFTAGYKVHDEVTLKAGYSQMLGTTSMVALKGGSTNETSNWGWIMLIIKPTFFQSK